MKIQLSKEKEVFNYCEPYIIAEIGANHNGDMELAKKIIDSAKECGAHAVKFQSWTPSSLIAKEEYDRNQSYDDGDGGKKHFGSLKKMVEKYYLDEENHILLKRYCDKLGIDFCSTPFANDEADLLNKLDVPFFKVASMDINNIPLLKQIAKHNKPVILSTGMATLAEIESAVKAIENEGNFKIIILHCIALYPPKIENINLRNILMLQKAFDYPIGFSDHTIGTAIPLASVALGSCIIEKHFTLDKDLPGWDHKISANPEELKMIVQESKNIANSLGSFKKIVSAEEEEKKLKFRRSIVALADISKDQVIKESFLTYKRPGTGIPPNEMNFVVGRSVNKTIMKDELIKWSDLK